MLTIQKNISLKDANTFRVDVRASFLADLHSLQDAEELTKDTHFKNEKRFILGQGSNTLFTKDLDGIVIRPFMKGISVIEETEDELIVEVAAGEDWTDFVSYCVEKGWGGIENLALIPGTVGAAPVQNIAAYGQNFVDTFESLQAIDLESGILRTFHKNECKFSYRDSIFKHAYKGKYVIVSVRLKLCKRPEKLETSYFQMHINRDSIEDELKSFAKAPYTIRDVYQAVVNIRTRKLPDPKKIPTVGSFFLNPTVSKDQLRDLQKSIHELQFYPVEQLNYKQLHDPSFIKEEFVKVPAGRLLQELGWLGKWKGHVGVHAKHSLIIVSDGQATGKEILEFSEDMKASVQEAYGIVLDTEINIV